MQAAHYRVVRLVVEPQCPAGAEVVRRGAAWDCRQQTKQHTLGMVHSIGYMGLPSMNLLGMLDELQEGYTQVHLLQVSSYLCLSFSVFSFP